MPTDAMCITGFFLGMRHGFDLDHITAIGDLVGAKAAATVSPAIKINKRAIKLQACVLAFSYALGHAAVVAILGLSALLFCKTLPAWVDPIMEKVVGSTLLILGVWMLYCARNANKPKSRGMILLQAISDGKQLILQKFLKQNLIEHAHDPSEFCNSRCAMAIGALHGVGAETGTQVLLVTSLAGANNLTGSLFMLTSFLIGLLISNIGLALFISEGYFRTVVSSHLSSVISIALALLSILLGLLLVCGRTELIAGL